MNNSQKLWWQQAKSDNEILLSLRRQDAAPCHQLHYLQMVTEKLSKAYQWRLKIPPKTKTHVGFVKFLKKLSSRHSELQKIAELFGFSHYKGFAAWANQIGPLAYEIERLAPNLANDGPNPEYPWPDKNPQFTPATFEFSVWRNLTGSGHGRNLLKVINLAILNFPQYC